MTKGETERGDSVAAWFFAKYRDPETRESAVGLLEMFRDDPDKASEALRNAIAIMKLEQLHEERPAAPEGTPSLDLYAWFKDGLQDPERREGRLALVRAFRADPSPEAGERVLQAIDDMRQETAREVRR